MSKVGDSKNLQLLYILTYADINGVGGDTYNSFNAKLLHDLYIHSLEVSENNDRITDAKKRVLAEKKVQNLEEFKTLPKTVQTKILRIESNLFFFKNRSEKILEIAKKAIETEDYSYTIGNDTLLTIEIFRRIPLNIGYLLATMSHLDVGSMEIITLFDDIKYFKIEFVSNVDASALFEIEENIKNAFDMSRHIPLKSVVIKPTEITIDCEHSLTHAEINVQTSNQKGLLAYIMSCFEELNINIVSAKIHSSKHKVRDTFLMQKQNDLCNNVTKIYELLTKTEA
jgi:[protein-PII] uridylyltransferase